VQGVAAALAGLRRERHLTQDCDVVVLADPSPCAGCAGLDRLSHLVAPWGARVAGSADEIGLRGAPVGVPRRHVVTGPSASGKSGWAEHLLAAEAAVTYLATGPRPGGDPEWAARVAAHVARRPEWWRTVETTDARALLTSHSGTDAEGARTASPAPTAILWDSVGSWLAAVLDEAGTWSDAPGWRQRVEAEMDAVTQAWRLAGGRVVAVTEEVGWGVVSATASGRLFTDLLGRLNQRLAAASDAVTLVVAGRTLDLS
jgi:adenosylcobinamide kinase/adenosylcobinamide-phosphate guanylyltransferase